MLTWLRSKIRNLFLKVMLRIWERIEPVEFPKRTWSPAYSDNVQNRMNLVMPLKNPGPETTAKLIGLLGASNDVNLAGLDNVATVHTARFCIVDGNLCMFSCFDGDFATYIRDFIAYIGSSFDALMEFVKDPPPTPVGLHPEAFIEWVDARDLYQVPDNTADLCADVNDLPRTLLLLGDRHKSIDIGFYRAYPGFSVAQVRQKLGVQW